MAIEPSNTRRPLQNTPQRTPEPNPPVVRHSFPATADSWPSDGASPHTMQILATKTGTLGENLGDAATAVVNTLRDVGAANVPTNTQELIDLGNTNADRDLLSERGGRILNIRNRLEGVFTFYIPTPIIFPLTNEYEDIRLTEKIGGTLGSFISSAVQVGVAAATEAGALAGYPINPKIEIVFRNLLQRKFQFEFLFAPASERETEALRLALIDIRKFASPTRLGIEGLLWKAPDVFDIILYHKGKENTQVPRISNCIMENMEIDYGSAQPGWTTFTNGHPVKTRVAMTFRELEPIDRRNIGDPATGGRGF